MSDIRPARCQERSTARVPRVVACHTHPSGLLGPGPRGLALLLQPDATVRGRQAPCGGCFRTALQARGKREAERASAERAERARCLRGDGWAEALARAVGR